VLSFSSEADKNQGALNAYSNMSAFENNGFKKYPKVIEVVWYFLIISAISRNKVGRRTCHCRRYFRWSIRFYRTPARWSFYNNSSSSFSSLDIGSLLLACHDSGTKCVICGVCNIFQLMVPVGEIFGSPKDQECWWNTRGTVFHASPWLLGQSIPLVVY
jgi:hypothetical protein